LSFSSTVIRSNGNTASISSFWRIVDQPSTPLSRRLLAKTFGVVLAKADRFSTCTAAWVDLLRYFSWNIPLPAT
jgi:hypothetical protein